VTEQQELLGAAQAFNEEGIAVIPFKIAKKENGEYDKQNLSAWKKWETEQQTKEDFNALNWKEANGFGVILGTKAKNGYYLSVIDYDVKGKVTEEVREKGKEILKDFPTTRTEETVNKGIHLVYWSKNKVSTDGTFHDQAALELLGEKKICLMAPSFGYRNIGSDIITDVENLEEKFYTILKNHGLTHTEETEIENQTDSYGFQLAKIVDLTNFTKISAYEFQGKHPTHDSTTERNFCINTKDNTWHCFRHNSGGGALQFLAVKEGIITCEQAKKGALRGKRFRDVLTLAVNQGLIDAKTLEQSEINPVLLAKDLMEDYAFATDKDTNELYYFIAEEGIYSNQSEQLIKREIAKRLDENFKTRYFSEVNEFITATAPLVKMNCQNPEMLAVKNGLLNVLTRQKTDFNPEIYITNKLDWEYNPNAKGPRNTKFLSDVVESEVQRTQIQELIGHCLYRKIITETCLICLGKGANGKSIFLTVIRTLLGEKNVSSHSIQELCYDKFAIETIKDKLANICADLPHKELMNTGIYRAIVSGDSTEIYVKNVQKTASIIPYTKYLYSANHIPAITNEEDSYAWYRRFIFADFNKTFTPENSIPRQILLGMLTTPEEMSARLNWALDGLARLIKNGDVSEKPTVEAIRKEYRKRSSTTLAYFDEQVTVTDNENDWIFTVDWFRDYVTYCHNNDLKPKSKGEFLNDIEQHLPGAKQTKIRPEPKSSPLSAWRYVKVVPRVPRVPHSTDKVVPAKKNQLENFTKNENLLEKRGTGGTGGTEKTRFCSEECKNFDKPSCQAPNWQSLNKKSEIPLGCPGYAYIVEIEEPS